MEPQLFQGHTSIHTRAVLLADRLDLTLFDATEKIAASPLLVRAGEHGCAALFRYGAVVLFGLQPVEEAAFLSDLRKLIKEPHAQPSEETAEIRFDAQADEQIVNGVLILRTPSVERLQLVADSLAESAVLHRYEGIVAATFDRVEPLASQLQQGRSSGKGSRELLQHIGAALLMEHLMVGRIEVAEKPEVLWEHAELEPLYARIASDYELRERKLALERKLMLISRTVETVLDLLQHRRSLRVEWYIVGLIVFEIILSLYSMFWA
ncbi:MAG: RMD1 family protein [Candidatus Hydrogenedentes bacterium]|nr:RMD1 family protein [Candidatus Hydrogenedentota bacterium]